LTRSLRRDGKYWFELENRAANKADVDRLLSKFEVDPENMLIIMHQNMVEQFTVLSPQEKLRMVEAAVGFESYRKNVLKAQKKLSRILSQQDSVEKLLESAQQTLSYWREQYDRYQQKKQLNIKRRFLERELAWAEVLKREKIVAKLKEQNQEKQNKISKIENETETLTDHLDGLQNKLEYSKTSWQSLFEDRLAVERERAKRELIISSANQALKETESWTENHRNEVEKVLEKISSLEKALHEKTNPVDLRPQISEIKASYNTLEDAWTQLFNIKNASLKKSVENSKEQLLKLDHQISDIKSKADSLTLEIESINNDVVECKISLALLQYQMESLTKSMKSLDKELQLALVDLDEYKKMAKKVGSRIVPMENTMDILDELRVTDGHLAALVDVSEDIERMYEKYSQLYLELKDKAQLVAENREKALEEVKARMEAWRAVIHNLLDKVNIKYRKILFEAYAVGEVRVVNEDDIEEAGLEILVGFKGGKPVPLNAYTQSGGERSTATVTFLLALQQHVNSPFRAVDEYDVHMDPKNREIIASLIVSSVAGLNTQYLAITPSQLTFTGKEVHLITVQNVEGTSLIKEVT
jgi:chromosome segregation ATPase